MAVLQILSLLLCSFGFARGEVDTVGRTEVAKFDAPQEDDVSPSATLFQSMSRGFRKVSGLADPSRFQIFRKISNQVSHYVRRRLQSNKNKNRGKDDEPEEDGNDCGLELPYRKRTRNCLDLVELEECNQAYQVQAVKGRLTMEGTTKYAFPCKMVYASKKDERRNRGTCTPATECVGEETWAPRGNSTNTTTEATLSPTTPMPTMAPTRLPTSPPTRVPTRSPTTPQPTIAPYNPVCGKPKGKKTGQSFYVDLPDLCHDLCAAQATVEQWTFEEKTTQCRCYHTGDKVKVKVEAAYFGEAAAGGKVTCGKTKNVQELVSEKVKTVEECQTFCAEHETNPAYFAHRKGKCTCFSEGKSIALGYLYGVLTN